MTEEERKAMEWMDGISQAEFTPPPLREYARTLKAMLAEPRLPEEPSDEMIAAMLSGMEGWIDGPTNRNYARALYANLYRHLTKPRTKTVEVWHVEYAGLVDRGCRTPEWEPCVIIATSRERADLEAAAFVNRPSHYQHIRVTGPHQQKVPA